MILIAPRYFRMEKAEKAWLQWMFLFFEIFENFGPNLQAEPQTPRLLCQTRSLSRPTKNGVGHGWFSKFRFRYHGPVFVARADSLFFALWQKSWRWQNDKHLPLGWGIPTKLQWWLELWGFFPQIAWKKSGLGTIWSNYSDLTRVFTPKWWFSKGKSPLFKGNPGWWTRTRVWVHLPPSNSQWFSSGVKNSGIFWLGDFFLSPPLGNKNMML